MEAIIERACGIDVHKKNIVACLLIGKPGEKPKKTVKTFSTMTEDLLACKDWLVSEGCTHGALESTGVYWKPVFNIINLFNDAYPYLPSSLGHQGLLPGNKRADSLHQL